MRNSCFCRHLNCIILLFNSCYLKYLVCMVVRVDLSVKSFFKICDILEEDIALVSV